MAITPSRRTANVFAPQRRQLETLQSLWAIWVLRLVLLSSPDRITLARLMEDEAAEFLGIGEIVEDDDGGLPKKFSPRDRKAILRRRLRELELESPDINGTVLGANIGWIASRLRLNKTEQAILAYAAMVDYSKKFRNALEAVYFECSKEQMADVLACLLNTRPDKIRAALSAKSTLFQTGLVRLASGNYEQIEDLLVTSDDLRRILFDRHKDADALIEQFFRKATVAKLESEDFAHLDKDFDLICSYLQAVGKKKTRGVNILLYGPPGVGKTEFARLIGQHTGYTLYEVACTDRDDNAIDGAARFSSFMLSQKMLANADPSVVLFDEIEDVFPSSSSGLLAMLLDDDEDSIPDSCDFGKAWINRVLESNPVPAIWITNRIHQIDRAFLRRFDLALEFSTPPKEIRRRIAEKHLSQTMVRPSFLDQLANWEDLTPAQIEKAAKVARHVAHGLEESEALAERTLKHSAKLLGQRAISPLRKHPTDYDLSFLNVNVPVRPLIEGIRARSCGTFCFYGPAGTGKTALARYMADEIGKPLLVRRASALLGKYVGESEQNIAYMFEEATESGALLLLDEADSFLADRRGAQQVWEVTQVNELLTQMEDFQGIFICTTNLMERLDPASLRRFAFKIRFDCMTGSQRRRLFEAELRRLSPGGEPVSEIVTARLDRLDKLTPGDFSTIARQCALLACEPSAEALLAALEAECRTKENLFRPIGFTV